MVLSMDILRGKEVFIKGILFLLIYSSWPWSMGRDFHFHLKCKKLNLSHLVFADDLMVFCRADSSSLLEVKLALDHLHGASGLKANPGKSNLYVGGLSKSDATCLAQQLGGFSWPHCQ